MPGFWRHVVATAALLALCCSGTLVRIPLSREGRMSVPAATPFEVVLGDVGLGALSTFDVQDAEEIEREGFEPEDISSVDILAMQLAVESPADATLDFLDRMQVFASAEGLPRIEIAVLDPVPRGVSSASFRIVEPDIYDYAIEHAMELSVEATGRRPDRETALTATVVFSVGVTAAGACRVIRGG